MTEKESAMQRNSHPSALAHQVFLRDEMADLIDQRFWIVLPFTMVQALQQLRLSPMGVIPQRDRRSRIIVDYTFSNVNKETILGAPKEAMQFGRAFDRLLHRIHHANRRFGSVFLIKVDLADGFYRVPLATADIPALAVAFPSMPQEPPLVALPLVLPMGWVLSPPYFCAFTETAADLANHYLADPSHQPRPHPLTHQANNPTNESTTTPTTPQSVWHRPPFLAKTPTQPLAYVDIYVDDFLALAQGPPQTLDNVRTTLFHAIDEVFRPLHPSDQLFKRNDPISIKKLNKGDARWTTRKVMLGWVIDTTNETIELPPHRAERLLTILQSLTHKRRVSLKTWQQHLGELHSMVLALPGGRGLFSTLYTAIEPSQSRIRINKPIHNALMDFLLLANDLTTLLTRIGEIVNTLPVAYGTADASGLGMGGIWFSGDPKFTPFLWRSPFAAAIQSRLITDDNPTGSISNSDLELAGQIAAQDALLQQYDCRERTISLCTDNVSARAWQRKGSRSTLGPSAYLLRLLSLHQRHYRYRATFDYLPGPLNVMADDASRLFTLSDSDLLTHFNLSYPQTRPWTIYILRPEMLSALTMALCNKRSNPESYLPALDPETLPGFDGTHIAKTWASHHTARTSGIHYRSSKCLPTVTEPAKSRPVINLSDLVPWKGPSAPSARRWPCWGPPTPALTPPVNPTTFYNNNSEATVDWTHRHLE